MKPYFSIRISINSLDSHEEGGERDEQSIKLTVARQTARDADDDGDAAASDAENICGKLVEAVEWLDGKSPMEKFLSFFAGQLFTGRESDLEEFLECSAECGDADFGDMIRRIAKKCEEMKI